MQLGYQSINPPFGPNHWLIYVSAQSAQGPPGHWKEAPTVGISNTTVQQLNGFLAPKTPPLSPARLHAASRLLANDLQQE
jgi:hypothetical protein